MHAQWGPCGERKTLGTNWNCSVFTKLKPPNRSGCDFGPHPPTHTLLLFHFFPLKRNFLIYLFIFFFFFFLFFIFFFFFQTLRHTGSCGHDNVVGGIKGACPAPLISPSQHQLNRGGVSGHRLFQLTQLLELQSRGREGQCRFKWSNKYQD